MTAHPTRPPGRADSRGPHRWAAAALIALVVGCAPATTATPAAPPAAATSVPAVPDEPAPGRLPDIPVTRADLADLPAAPTTAPTSLSLPALDVVVPIDPVGVADDGQMEIPPLAERAGWYRFGAVPGATEGTAVIAAHVDSVASAGLGPFAGLKDLAVGDRVSVTLSDGATATYAVTAVISVTKPEITWQDVFVRDGAHRLVLVTCGGSFRGDVGSYSDNVIVTADVVVDG